MFNTNNSNNNNQGINWGNSMFSGGGNNSGQLDFGLNQRQQQGAFGQVDLSQGGNYFGQGNTQFGVQSPIVATEGSNSIFSGLNAGNVGMGINAIKGLGQLYFAQQAMAEQKKNNKFNRKAANRNLANQAKVTNASIERRAISDASGQNIQGEAQAAYVQDYLRRYGNDGRKL